MNTLLFFKYVEIFRVLANSYMNLQVGIESQSPLRVHLSHHVYLCIWDGLTEHPWRWIFRSIMLQWSQQVGKLVQIVCFRWWMAIVKLCLNAQQRWCSHGTQKPVEYVPRTQYPWLGNLGIFELKFDLHLQTRLNSTRIHIAFTLIVLWGCGAINAPTLTKKWRKQYFLRVAVGSSHQKGLRITTDMIHTSESNLTLPTFGHSYQWIK